MVDYMKTSMSMRTTWPLKPEDQKIFEDFDFVSNKVFEEELTKAFESGFSLGGSSSLDLGGADKVAELH